MVSWADDGGHVRVRRGGGRITRGERRRKRERAKEGKREIVSWPRGLEEGTSSERRISSSCQKGEKKKKKEIYVYPRLISLSHYRVALLHFCGIRTNSRDPTPRMNDLGILPIVPDDHEGRCALAKHRDISRKNTPSLSRHRVAWSNRVDCF